MALKHIKITKMPWTPPGGEFECKGVTYKAGDYIFRPVGVPHQSSSRTGAETLLVYVKKTAGSYKVL
jgi:uncharacterized RmlC-like cupin family protein